MFWWAMFFGLLGVLVAVLIYLLAWVIAMRKDFW